MAWYPIFRRQALDRLGRTVTVELQRDLASAPGVETLPIIAEGGLQVAWEFSDDLGLGVLSYRLPLPLFDAASTNAPDRLSGLFETVEPSELRVVVTVSGVGVVFTGNPAYGTTRRGLVRGRRRIQITFSASTILSSTISSSLGLGTGGVTTAADMVETALGATILNPSGDRLLFYGHSWRSQSVWPPVAQTSFLHRLYVPWMRMHVGETWPEVVESLSRALMLRVGRSTTLGQSVVCHAMAGWGGASFSVTGQFLGTQTVAVTDVGAVEVAGEWGGERVGHVSVATSVQPEFDDLPGVLRDRLGVVRDMPGEAGNPETGFRTIRMRTPYASEPGTTISGLSGPHFGQALTVLVSAGGAFRTVGQVYGLALDDADACLQLEQAVASSLSGWLSPSRRRVHLVARKILDPMLPFGATLPEDIGRVYLPVSGTWDLLGVRTDVRAVELSRIGEDAPPAPTAWYEATSQGNLELNAGWERYTVAMRSNRRLTTLTLGADHLASGVWTAAQFRRPGGSLITTFALSGVTSWESIDPEALSVEFDRSAYAGETMRWRVEVGGSVVWTSPSFVVPA